MKPMFLRRRLALATAAVAAFATVAACSSGGSPHSNGGSSSGGSSDSTSGKPVTITFSYWSTDTRVKLTNQVIAAFEKKYPNITVKQQYKDWTGYWDQLATETAANSAPDVMQMDELYLASYAQRGTLLDLTKQSDALSTADFDKSVLQAGQVGGTQYALPVGLNVYSFLANADLFKKYNVPLPDDKTWTWDDLDRIGQQISKASGGAVSGIESWGFDAGSLNIWARQSGGALFGSDGKVTISPTVLADYWKYLLKISDDGAAPKPSVTVEQAAGGVSTSGLSTGKAAIATGWNTQITAYSKSSGAHLVILQIPGESTAASRGAYYKGSMYWAVSSKSKHPKEAAEFVNFLDNDATAANILMTDRGIPANPKMRQAIAPSMTAFDKAATDFLNSVKVGDKPYNITPNGASDVEKILGRYTQQVLFKQTTPEQAASAFIKELQGDIDSAK